MRFPWQHLRIKKFYGASDNAVKTQIWIAVSAYVLIAIVRKRLGLEPSLYTLFQVRFRCVNYGHIERCVTWPSHCRSTPELDRLRAHLSALMPFRVAANVLMHLLPADVGMSPRHCAPTRSRSASNFVTSQRPSRLRQP